MSFPSELVSMSLQYLNKSDLKNARLVSKQWSGCASECLFTKLFVSPHRLNLEGFVAIAQDPRLSKCVQELEYDATHFSPYITISQYFEILWHQTWKDASIKELGLKGSDTEIHYFVNLLNNHGQNRDRSDQMMAKAWVPCCGLAFIHWGYWKWMEEARFEKNCIERNTFLKTLVSGLQNLNHLRSVKLRGKWPYRAKVRPQGSPLARAWNQFHARPGGVIAGSGIKGSKTIEDFRILTFALSKAGITGGRDLSIECNLPPPTFRSTIDQTHDFMGNGVSVYSRLEKLKLSLAGWCADPSVVLYSDLHGVGRMLESMMALKQLEIELPDDHANGPPVYFPYQMVFPKNGRWPQLTTFTVRNLAITTEDLVILFEMRMPSLSHLAFGNISLLVGQWEGIVEYLRISNRLSSFHIPPVTFLLHNRHQIYLSPASSSPLADHHRRIGRSYIQNIQSVMDYVVNQHDNRSLKHPSLMPYQSASLSLEYMRFVLDSFQSPPTDCVREHLMKMIAVEAARYSTQLLKGPLDLKT